MLRPGLYRIAVHMQQGEIPQSCLPPLPVVEDFYILSDLPMAWCLVE